MFQEPKKLDWRKKREEFKSTLQAAKEAQRHLAKGGDLRDLPPPPPSDTSDYVQCPYCHRRYKDANKLEISLQSPNNPSNKYNNLTFYLPVIF